MSILDPGFKLDLRPMRYPQFWDALKKAEANNWRVEEIDFGRDVVDLRTKMPAGMQHLVKRIAAFFATGDSMVANNVAVVLYKHVNAPEARMYLARQLFEEALHVKFYLTLIDSYISDPGERASMFQAITTVPSIASKGKFCVEWMDDMFTFDTLDSDEKKQKFLLNLLTFAAAVEGIFFYAAFAYVFFLRSRGLLPGLGQGTNWVFRDETMHMANGFQIVRIAQKESPHLFTSGFWDRYEHMLEEAVSLELDFSRDVLDGGVAGLSQKDMGQYLRYVADQRLDACGRRPKWHAKNPFDFLTHQDVPEMANFFERQPTAYAIGTPGAVNFNADF